MMHLPALFACSPLLGYVAAVRSIASPNHQGLRAQKGIVKCDELSFFNVPRLLLIDAITLYHFVTVSSAATMSQPPLLVAA
eukprot:14230-Heterococcus_DN1.PRE.1